MIEQLLTCSYPDTGIKSKGIEIVCQQPCVLLAFKPHAKQVAECVFYEKPRNGEIKQILKDDSKSSIR